jgi:hypothetical protein
MTAAKGRRIASIAAASVGQPQLDKDALQKVVDEHFPDAGADVVEETPATAPAPKSTGGTGKANG